MVQARRTKPNKTAIDQSAIEDALNAKLARYKIPKHYTKIDALPRNGAGKVLKTVLRAMALQQTP